MNNCIHINKDTQKSIMEFFLKYSIPKILKDNDCN